MESVDAVNKKQLSEICRASFDGIASIAAGNWTSERYLYKNNGGQVLAVAHTDFIGMTPEGLGGGFGSYDIRGRHYLISSALDDRLGVYAILKHLPEQGLKFDVLLTQDEESGKSTASLFKTDKKYNWVFSFDRHGLDCVMYKYRDNKMSGRLKKYNIDLGYGSYSDICELELGVKGLNFGVGYESEHTDLCHVDISDFLVSMARFKKFFKKYKTTRFKHAKDYQFGRGTWYGDWTGDTQVWQGRDCATCGEFGWYRANYNKVLCNDCKDKLDATARGVEGKHNCEWCQCLDAGVWREDLNKYVCNGCWNLVYGGR